jgi:hypothetical protein
MVGKFEHSGGPSAVFLEIIQFIVKYDMKLQYELYISFNDNCSLLILFTNILMSLTDNSCFVRTLEQHDLDSFA